LRPLCACCAFTCASWLPAPPRPWARGGAFARHLVSGALLAPGCSSALRSLRGAGLGAPGGLVFCVGVCPPHASLASAVSDTPLLRLLAGFSLALDRPRAGRARVLARSLWVCCSVRSGPCVVGSRSVRLWRACAVAIASTAPCWGLLLPRRRRPARFVPEVGFAFGFPVFPLAGAYGLAPPAKGRLGVPLCTAALRFSRRRRFRRGSCSCSFCAGCCRASGAFAWPGPAIRASLWAPFSLRASGCLFWPLSPFAAWGAGPCRGVALAGRLSRPSVRECLPPLFVAFPPVRRLVGCCPLGSLAAPPWLFLCLVLRCAAAACLPRRALRLSRRRCSAAAPLGLAPSPPSPRAPGWLLRFFSPVFCPCECARRWTRSLRAFRAPRPPPRLGLPSCLPPAAARVLGRPRSGVRSRSRFVVPRPSLRPRPVVFCPGGVERARSRLLSLRLVRGRAAVACAAVRLSGVSRRRSFCPGSARPRRPAAPCCPVSPAGFPGVARSACPQLLVVPRLPAQPSSALHPPPGFPGPPPVSACGPRALRAPALSPWVRFAWSAGLRPLVQPRLAASFGARLSVAAVLPRPFFACSRRGPRAVISAPPPVAPRPVARPPSVLCAGAPLACAPARRSALLLRAGLVAWAVAPRLRGAGSSLLCCQRGVLPPVAALLPPPCRPLVSPSLLGRRLVSRRFSLASRGFRFPCARGASFSFLFFGVRAPGVGGCLRGAPAFDCRLRRLGPLPRLPAARVRCLPRCAVFGGPVGRAPLPRLSAPGLARAPPVCRSRLGSGAMSRWAFALVCGCLSCFCGRAVIRRRARCRLAARSASGRVARFGPPLGAGSLPAAGRSASFVGRPRALVVLVFAWAVAPLFSGRSGPVFT